MRNIFLLFLMFISLFILTGCSTEKFQKPDIKDDFCGTHIDFQYCKCAFHDEYCDAINMDEEIADMYVQAKYDVWVADLFVDWIKACANTGGYPKGEKCMRCKESTSKEECGQKTQGVVESDGKLYINSRPGEVLNIKESDLPEWAKGQLVVAGALSVCVGPPNTIKTGDSNVLYNGLPVARFGDKTVHGGAITEGSDNIFVNGIPSAYVGAQTVCPLMTGLVPHIGGPIASTGY